MQSSNVSETGGTPIGMPELSEVLESTIPSSPSDTGDTAFPDPDQFNRFPKRGRSPSRVRSAPNLVVCMGSTPAPLLDRLNHPVQTSGSMSASNSEDDPDPGQDADDPLPSREEANAAQRGDIAEQYVPWLADVDWLDGDEDLGLIPRFLEIFYIRVAFILVAGLSTAVVIYVITAVYIQYPNCITSAAKQCWFIPFMDFAGKFMTGLIVWLPLMGVCLVLNSNPQSSRLTVGTVISVGACLFRLLSWCYCALVSSERVGAWSEMTFGQYIQTWSTGTVPQSFKGCDAHVEPNQASLFNTDIYYAQFARTWYYPTGNSTDVDEMTYETYDMERFRSIQVSQTLCGQGFEGNNDLYGLGIRTSLYLQSLSPFLANNFLPGTRQELQRAYLIFSLAICLATIIGSFAQACVFSIEIEVMYWMYWGGYICVFGSAPCPVRLGSKMEWIKPDWTTINLFTTHALMIYHGVWFIFNAYDRVFSRMPCGTYHFFVFPILGPSQGLWTLRDYLTLLIIPLTPALLVIFPVYGLLLASEVKYTIQHSATYRNFFPKSIVSERDQPQTTEYNASVKTSLGLRVYLSIGRQYRAFRELFHFPSHGRRGIRLVTPIDIKDRRLYRIRWAAMGLSSYILSIVAIEVILKWNKVSGVYSIASTGQYVALIIGVGSFVSVCWTLVRQECQRRRNLKRRQVANQNENGIELNSLSHDLADAISHAFSRPDIGFSTNGGAFPITSSEEEEEAARSLNTLRPSPNIEALMSGALDVQSDLEGQTPPNG